MADPLIGLTFTFDAPSQSTRDRDQAPRGGLGSQVLPVAELDDDFEGEPGDGSEYLFLVRREAATHARILRVADAFVTMEVDDSSAAAQEEDDEPPASRPDEAWRKVFVRNFEAARQRMLAAPKASLPPADPALIPNARDEGAWRVFINGKRSKPNPPPKTAAAKKATLTEEDELAAAKKAILASLDLDAGDALSPAASTPPEESTLAPAALLPASAPEYERLPQLPSPALLLSIPRPYLIHVLSHFDDWYTERLDQYKEKLNFVPSTIFAPPAVRRKAATAKPLPSAPTSTLRPPLPSAHEAHWMLSLLTRLEQVLDGEDLATLRQLARTLRSLAEESHKVHIEGRAAPGTGRSMQQRAADEEEAEGRARCWMVVAAVANVWQQGDLWDPRF